MVPRIRTLFGILLVSVLFSGSAVADVVHLQKGGRLEGILVWEDAATITIDLGVGQISVPRAAVLKIERKESALAAYRTRLAAIQPGDLGAHADLARYATRSGLRAEARLMWARVISLDPRHVEAHLALGHVLVDGRFVDEDEAQRARGLVRFQGRWMTPSEQEFILRDREMRAESDRRVADARRATRDAEERALRAEREAERARASAAANANANSPWGYGSNVLVGSPYWGGYGGGCAGRGCATVPEIWPQPRPAPVATPIPRTPPVRPSSIR